MLKLYNIENKDYKWYFVHSLVLKSDQTSWIAGWMLYMYVKLKSLKWATPTRNKIPFYEKVHPDCLEYALFKQDPWRRERWLDGTVFGLPVSTDMSGFGGPKASTVVTDGRESHNKKATIYRWFMWGPPKDSTVDLKMWVGPSYI